MKVRAIEAGIDQWIGQRVTPPRTAGQHVSVILTDMLKTIRPKKYHAWGKARPDDARDPMWEAGYLWEDVLAKALSDRPAPGCYLVAPFELELDGIFGTPDRLLVQEDPDGGLPRIVDEEVKFTWMSCKELLVDPSKRPETVADWNAAGLGDTKFVYWLLQSKTYAAMLFLNHYTAFPHWHSGPTIRFTPDVPITPLVRLRALFVNGAYRDALAIPAAFEIEYTADELTTWWQTFRAHAESMQQSTLAPTAQTEF